MKIDIEKIKSNLDILQVVKNEGFDPKKNGRGYKLLCPFHDDKNPSLSVDDKKQLFHCFGCGKSGDVIKFIEYLHNYSFKEATQYLVKKNPNLKSFGGDIYSSAISSRLSADSTRKQTVKNKPENSNQKAENSLNELVEKQHQSLFEKKQALEYLEKRGIADHEVIRKFKIGYSTGYVTFPFFDDKGHVGEIYSRSILNNAKLPHKYLPGPHKGILNLEELKTTDEIYLCECVIDAISLYCMGIKNVTCSFGKGNLTDELKEKLSKHYKRVLITYDNDTGNDESAVKTADTLARFGLTSERIILPPTIKDTNYFLTSALSEGKKIEEIKYLFNKLQRIPYAAPEKKNNQSENFRLISDESNILLFRINGKLYKIRGLKRTAQMDLHVLLSTEINEKKTLGKVDLLSDRSRQRYSQAAKDRLGVSEFDIAAELEDLMIFLDELQEKEYLKNIEEAKDEFMAPPLEITQERIEKAKENLTLKDYLTETLLEDLDYIQVVGEEENKLLYTLAILSSMEKKPIHVLIIARPGIGKSYIQKIILQLFPKSDWVRISSATKQVMYYVPKEAFANKALSIDETSGVHQDSFYTFRTLMSEGKLELLTTEKDVNGVNKAKRRMVDGPVAILLSTTSMKTVDNETRSRMVVTFGDESEDQTKRIIDAEFFMNNMEEGLKRTKEIPTILQKHQDMMFVLRQTLDINFVYADGELEKRVKLTEEHVQSRRNITIYTTLIRCISRTRVFRRGIKIKNNEKFFYISKEDVELAEKIMKKIIMNQLTDLKGPVRHFYHLITKYVDEKRGDIPRNEFEFKRRDIRNYTGWGDTQTKEHLRELIRLEYIIVARAKKGNATIYRLIDNDFDFKKN